MSSFLTKKDGVYDPSARYAVTNIWDKEYRVVWDGKEVAIIPPGATVELPEHLAILTAIKLTDIIMIEESKIDRDKHSEPYYSSPLGSRLAIPEARKPFEDKILRKLVIDPNAPQFKIMQSEFINQLKSDLSAENAKPISAVNLTESEFASVDNVKKQTEEFPELKKKKVK